MRRTFGTLDGLRGVAALVVLLYHLAPAWPSLPFFGSAYLSVDLFFMLSGFVIGHAYDARLANGMTLGRFVVVRVVRLYPLYLLGCAIGTGAALAVALPSHQWRMARSIAGLLPWAAVMLPHPGADPAGWFSLNPPAWSLFFELVINVGYAMLFPRLGERVLAGTAVVAGGALVAQSIHYGTINFDARGWALSGVLARPAFSFAVGLLLLRRWRRGRLPRPAIPPGLILLLFLATLAIPATGPAAGVLAPLAVMLVFPAVVTMAVANEPSGGAATAMRRAGWLSYPVYALHFPLIAALNAAAYLGLVAFRIADLIALPVILAVAWAAGRFVDDPVRGAIGRRLDARRAMEAAPAF